jgi:putative nucleotidyltransferase with HDIG domain
MNSAHPDKDYLNTVTEEIHHSRSQTLNPAGRYLDRVASLPPAPTLVTELMALFREPDRDVDQVVQLISYEPSLTAQILRMCNSACFAGEQPPGDIFEAVSRLGFYQVYCLVVTLFGAQAKRMEGADRGVNVESLWRHSVAAAVSAAVVEEEAGQEKGAAFTAGLLHDIGKLALASVEGEPYARLFQLAREQGVALAVMERSAFGMDHAELGGELMRRWNLPPDVVAAVRHHHQFEGHPRASPFQRGIGRRQRLGIPGRRLARARTQSRRSPRPPGQNASRDGKSQRVAANIAHKDRERMTCRFRAAAEVDRDGGTGAV